MAFAKKEIIPIALILAMFIIGIVLYPSMPDKVPIHWNSKGEIDKYGSKFTGLLLIPIIIMVVYLFLLAIPKIEVYKQNMQKFAKHYYGIRLAIVLFLFIIYIATLTPHFGIEINMGFIMIPAFAALFFYLGYAIKYAKRNFFIGIRTPWTLSSSKVWEKTQRIGGILFQVFAVYALLTLFFPDYFFWLFLMPLIILVLFLFVYSYLLYEKERKNV